MAVPLLLATFGDFLRGALLLLAIDNSGVVGSLIAGRGTAFDHNAAIARVWLHMAELGVVPHVVRVETTCNVADGPTRDDFRFLSRLQARFVEPVWPEWIEDYLTIRFE